MSLNELRDPSSVGCPIALASLDSLCARDSLHEPAGPWLPVGHFVYANLMLWTTLPW